ncbi:hypothetical protein G6F42_008163 [Rhizopus arrhizus]|nr:hypothetical protein G6F42_008163 [Rhizopus arrhizus]
MGPLRGAYNKTPDPALSEAQLSTLETEFQAVRKQLTCPVCFETTTFHRHGSSPKEPFQPQFTCTACHKTIKAYELYPIIHAMYLGTQTSTAQSQAMDAESNTSTDPKSGDSQSALVQQLCQTVERLTNELSQARHEIQHLQERINTMNSTTTPLSPLEFPTLQESQIRSTAFPDAPWNNPSKIQALKQPSIQRSEQRRMQREATAARFFQPPSENQGFKYLYIPTKARIPVGTIRTTFRKLGVNNARLLDIHYPARNTVAVLIHNDYEAEFVELLTRKNVHIRTDFTPFNGKILADPKYTSLPQEERDSIAIRLQKLRLSRALDYIRSPVKYAVARYFLDQEWISRTRYDEIMADRYNTKLTSIFDQISQQQTTQDIFNDVSDNDLDMEAVDELPTGTSSPALH